MQDLHFETIYEKYRKPIFRLCRGYVNDDDLAKDMVQETFIAVFRQLPKFRAEAAIGTWIYRIASNICLKQINQQKKLPKAEIPVSLSNDDTLHEKIEKDKMTDFLYQCISELPEIERIIISMELENVKQAEIAEILGISPGNVRIKIHRIKEKLTEKFRHYGNQI